MSPKDASPQLAKDLEERTDQLRGALEEYETLLGRLKAAIVKVEKAAGIVRHLVGGDGD